MIHIWLPNPQAPLRIWQDTTLEWQIVENWQEVAALAALQTRHKNKTIQACFYFPSLYLLSIQPNLTAAQLKSLGESGRRYLFEDISIASVDDLQVKVSESRVPFTQASIPNLYNPNTDGDESSIEIAPAHSHLYALHAADRALWESAANLAGVTFVAMLPDFLLLPNQDDIVLNSETQNQPLNKANHADEQSLIFYQDADTQLLRINPEHGMAVTHLPLILMQYPQQFNQLYLTGHISESTMTQMSPLAVDYQVVDIIPRPVNDPQRHLLNFAQVTKTTKLPAYAKTIALVLMAALFTNMLVDGMRWYFYQQATTQAQQLLQQQYQQWSPNERFNPKLTVKRQLADKLITNQTQTPTVLATLATIQPILRQYQIDAQQVNYQQNKLQLQLVAKNPTSFNQALTDMTNQGLQAKLGALNPAQHDSVASIEITL